MKNNLLLDISYDTLVCELLLYLPFADVLSLSQVNKQLHRVIDDEDIWKCLFKIYHYPESLLGSATPIVLTCKQYMLAWQTYNRCTSLPMFVCTLCSFDVCDKHFIASVRDVFTKHEADMIATDGRCSATNLFPTHTGICLSCSLQMRLITIHHFRMYRQINPCDGDTTETSIKFNMLFKHGLASKIRCCSSST